MMTAHILRLSLQMGEKKGLNTFTQIVTYVCEMIYNHNSVKRRRQ